MNVSIFVITLIMFSINNLVDSSKVHTLTSFDYDIFFLTFIIHLMCFSVIIVAYFSVSLD